MVKQIIETDEDEIYNPFPSSPVNPSIVPFLPVSFNPDSPSAFLSVNFYLLFGFVRDMAIVFASSFLRAISSASIPIVKIVFY